jgi:hypothetical protein
VAVLPEDGCVPRGFDRRTRVPAELVAERVVGLLSDGKTSAVALIADNFPATFLGFMNHLHCAHDVDAGIESALIENH